MTESKLLLVSGNSMAFRAFFALHNSLEHFKNRSSLHTNVIYTFSATSENVMQKEQPTHVLVAFDAGKATFRAEIYAEYKGGRPKAPGGLKGQVPYVRDLLTGLEVQYYELPNYETGDIIGTLTEKVDKGQFDVVVLSGDRDSAQLTSKGIKADIAVKSASDIENYTSEHVTEKCDGLTPKQTIDTKGLAEDASNNIPGVTKIGEKTAIKLLKQYGSVEGIYEHIDEMRQGKMKKSLIDDKEQAPLSKELATINTSAPVNASIDSLKYEGKNLDKLIPFYKEMDFD